MCIVERYRFHETPGTKYAGIMTLFDFEENIDDCLREIKLPPSDEDRVMLVDACIQLGIGSERFIEQKVGHDGTILLDEWRSVVPSESVQELTRRFLKERADIVSNSGKPGVAQLVL